MILTGEVLARFADAYARLTDTCGCKLCNHGGGDAPPPPAPAERLFLSLSPVLPQGMSIAQYQELRLARCPGCNTLCARSLLGRDPLIFFSPADDTIEPHRWQWLCRCLSTNVTQVTPP